jgi:hypothetical protein
MEPFSLWALIVVLFTAALTATLKAAGYRHSLKLANEEIELLRKKLDVYQQQQHDNSFQKTQTNAKPQKQVAEVAPDKTDMEKLHKALHPDPLGLNSFPFSGIRPKPSNKKDK